MNTKVITSTWKAKVLLQNGFIIKDIAPHKNNPDRSVFIFHNSKKLEDFLFKLNKEGE